MCTVICSNNNNNWFGFLAVPEGAEGGVEVVEPDAQPEIEGLSSLSESELSEGKKRKVAQVRTGKSVHWFGFGQVMKWD